MGTTLISRAHIKGKNHSHCEDKSSYRRKQRYDIAVLCDGAGSAIYAKEGARIIAQYVATHLPSMVKRLLREAGPGALYHELPTLLTDSIHETLIRKTGNDDISAYASTLLFALYSHPHDRWLFGHIGDGVIGGITKKGEVVTISSPHNGEFANETYFVTDRNSASKLHIFTRKGVRGAILMSDGSAHTFFSRNKKSFASGVSKLFSWQCRLTQVEMNAVLRSNIERTASKRSADDCSIVMIQPNCMEA
jgi:hypothetical protein